MGVLFGMASSNAGPGAAPYASIACVIAPYSHSAVESLLAAVGRADQRLTPTCYADAPTALLAMRQTAVVPRIIVLGTRAPDLDDMATIKAIRRQLPRQPILAVSQEMTASQILSLIRHGAAGCVRADANTDEVAQAIRHVLKGDFPVSPSFAGHLFRMAGSPLFDAPDHAVRLTPRERDTLWHLSKGHTYADTAVMLGVSLSTVQTHVRSLYGKLNCNTLVQALNTARRQNLI